MTRHQSSLTFAATFPLTAATLGLVMFCGCGVQPSTSVATIAAHSVTGTVMGGQQPISGATIRLYAVGTTADGSPSSSLMTTAVTTASDGTFTLTGHYSCPVSNPYVYLLATGGNAGFGTNSSIALIAALGQCSTLSATTYIVTNEVTTAAAVTALSPYMASPTAIGSGGSDAAALTGAFALAAEYANFATGTSPGTGVPGGFTVPTALINTLADVVASCVNTAGPASSACTTLFAGATASVGSAPNDVATALVNIANNPSGNVASIFGLATASPPFQPTLGSAPANWNVALTPSGPAPTVAATSLVFATSAPGIAAGSQTVTISNPGTSSTTLNSIAVIGAAAGDYSVAANTCSSALGSNASCNVTVSFTPSSNGARYADLAVANSVSASPIYVPLSGLSSPPSQWVYYSGGNLAYKTLSNPDNTGAAGYDQIMDFSTAGYMAGGTAIPTAPVAVTLSPSGGDDTSAIQSAINSASALTLNTTTGLRGAVLLNPGSYTVSSTLNITASGVVLRGSGSGTSPATNTVITQVAATTPYPLIVLGSSGSPTYTSGTITNVTDSYVPAGSLTLDVSNASVYSVGGSVVIKRPATTNWITFMDMLPSEIQSQSNCSGGTCNWISVSSSAFKTDRIITAISGNRITLDSPMSDSLDSTYLGAGAVNVQAFTFPTRISQVGVENLRAIMPVPPTNLVPPTASYQFVVTYAVLNAWIRNLTSQDALQAIDIEPYGKQVTVSNVAITHTVTQTDSAKFEDYYVNGATQVLMDTVSDVTDNMYFFSTSSETQGPIVLRNGSFSGNTNIEPHQRWATGVLVENTNVLALSSSDSAGQINFWDRGDYGTGQGWAVGWGVVWNSTTAGGFTMQQPPGSQNWCIGCVGSQIVTNAPGGSTNLTQGAIDSSGTYVYPVSLYQAQLTQRLGAGVVAQ